LRGGRGQLFLGESLIGLSRAFLYAGVHSVIIRCWNVSDISTKSKRTGWGQGDWPKNQRKETSQAYSVCAL